MVGSFITLPIFYFGGANFESQSEDRQTCLPIFRSFSTKILEYWLRYYLISFFLIPTNSSFTAKHNFMLQNLCRCKSLLNKPRFTHVK